MCPSMPPGDGRFSRGHHAGADHGHAQQQRGDQRSPHVVNRIREASAPRRTAGTAGLGAAQARCTSKWWRRRAQRSGTVRPVPASGFPRPGTGADGDLTSSTAKDYNKQRVFTTRHMSNYCNSVLQAAVAAAWAVTAGMRRGYFQDFV